MVRDLRDIEHPVKAVTSHKVSAQGWHCSKCGKKGVFKVDTRTCTTMNDFMALLSASHREVLRASPIAVRCGAEPGHGRDGWVKDSDGRTWCGDFVIGGVKGPWLRPLPAQVA